MRTYNSVVLLFTFWGMCAAPLVSFGQSSTAPSPEITVRLSTPERSVTVGASIHVEVRISNTGDAPTLVANSVSMASGGTAFLKFKLSDARGRVSPAVQLIADYPPTIPSNENAAAKLLSSWILLYPQTSLLFDVSIDQSLYEFLGEPGKYRLSASYASGGIFYGRNKLGLSSDVLNSLPYPSWSGNVSTNEIPLTIVAPKKPKK